MEKPRPIPATALTDRTITGLPLVIWIFDHLSGERAPLVPGLFEKAMERENSCCTRQQDSA